MLLTEKEARQQTCPVMRYCINDVNVIQDGQGAIYVHQSCTASDCKMAWRWEGGDFAEVGENRRGYCGLAGRPE
jgi:hypothetical protein